MEEVKAKLSYQEFTKWVLYFRENPPIREHQNNLSANVAYTVYSVNAGKKGKRLKFDDFRLNYKQEEKQTQTDIFNAFKSLKGIKK